MDEKGEKGEPGLHLTDKTIHRISGPVSMYYLKPKSNRTFWGSGENLPLILLWGDRHRDDQEMCDNCSCSDEACCYPIYDREFLKELDKLAANYPVDFYTESSVDLPALSDMENPKNILFHRFLSQTTLGCHRKEERSMAQYKNSCPTENIRWHYSDPRYMAHSMELYAFLFIRIIITDDIYSMLTTLDTNLTFADNNSIPKSDKIQEKIVSTFIHCHTRIFAEPTRLFETQYSKKYPAYQAGLALFLDIARNVTSTNNSMKNLISLYVDSMIKNDKYSVIYKQFIKLLPDKMRDYLVVFFMRIIYRTSQNFISHLTAIKNMLEQQPRIRSFFNDFFQPDYVTRKKYLSFQEITKKEVSIISATFKLLSGLLFEFSIIFVELYTLFRMLKPPQGSSSPFLVMGFYGANHTRNMVSILQDINYFNYEVVYEKIERIKENNATPSGHRCITIDTPVYLARDLEERAQAILAHGEYQQSYKDYYSILTEERRSRGLPPPPFPALAFPSPAPIPNASAPISNGSKKTFKVRKPRRAPNALPAAPAAPASSSHIIP
jgi:hypothetical protein